jgi:hypothetical protein
MADELDPKYPNAGQRRSGEGGGSNEEEITGNVSEEDEEFEDIDDAEEDEEDLES